MQTIKQILLSLQMTWNSKHRADNNKENKGRRNTSFPQ